jgi:hypothetical protein
MALPGGRALEGEEDLPAKPSRMGRSSQSLSASTPERRALPLKFNEMTVLLSSENVTLIVQ